VPEIVVSERIEAPREAVWLRATDLERWPETIEAITKIENVTGGPMRVGTRFRETRVMFGKEATEEMEVLEFEPPSRYVLTARSHGSSYRTEVCFDEADGATRVTFDFRATPETFGAKVMGALTAPMMKKMLVKCVAGDLMDLKRACESHDAAPA